MKARNHYSTLSIDRCATCDEIKRAYRTLAKRFHPDVTDDLDGEAKFKDVAEAYRTLKYPENGWPTITRSITFVLANEGYER